MTWSTIIIIALFILLALQATADGAIIRTLRRDVARLTMNNEAAADYLSSRQPSYSGVADADAAIAALEHCLTCRCLRAPFHFLEHPSHVKL